MTTIDQSPQRETQLWESFSVSRLGIGAVLLAAAMAGGCSAKYDQITNSDFYPLPPPPLDSRVHLGTVHGERDQVTASYIVWDDKTSEFLKKDIIYNSRLGYPYESCGGVTQTIPNGEVFNGGMIVNQQERTIILGNGHKIEGKSGDILDAQGKVLIDK